MSREPDFSAKNRIFKNFLKCLKACLVGVFWVFQSIFYHCSTSGPRTGFLSREPDFQKFLKKPQNMFSWCFLSVSMYFSIVRNLCWEPHCWAENRIFKNFSKSLKTCSVGVFWVFHVFFSIVRHLSREPDFWAENSVFKTFFKSLYTCLGGVFWMLHGIFSIVRHLSWEPDFWAKNRVFTNFVKWL